MRRTADILCGHMSRGGLYKRFERNIRPGFTGFGTAPKGHFTREPRAVTMTL